MQQSNYEVMHLRMRGEFLKYDQEKMIKRLSVPRDDNFLYINFCGEKYSIDRKTAAVFRCSDMSPAQFNVVMTLYDVLTHSADTPVLAGKFCALNSLKSLVSTSTPGASLFSSTESLFTGRADALRYACEKLGGTPEKMGDVSYKLPVFDFFPLILRFYDEDDEFPAQLQFLWDENSLSFVYYETAYYIMGHLRGVLLDIMENFGK